MSLFHCCYFFRIFCSIALTAGLNGAWGVADALAGDPLTRIPIAEPVVPVVPPIKVYVNAFRGAAGETTAKLVRMDLQRSGAFTLVSSESPDAYAIHAEATGGWVDAVIFRPDARVLFQRRYESPNLRQNVHRLADDFTEIVTKKPGIAGSVIAFVSDTSGISQVYLCDSDGNDIRQVTSDNRIAGVHPGVSLTNGRIVYTTVKNGYADIWSIDLVTEESKRLINAPGDNRHPVLSPDGERMAVTMSYSGHTDLYVTTAQGGRGRRLTDDDAVESDPTWAPDGRLLAFGRVDHGGDRSQIYYISSLGGAAEPLPEITENTAEFSFSQPDWSPDGKHIVFTASVGDKSQIAIFNVSARKTSLLPNTPDASSPTWAPDSRHIAYIQDDALWVLDVSDTTVRSKIVDDFGHVSEPSWSR